MHDSKLEQRMEKTRSNIQRHLDRYAQIMVPEKSHCKWQKKVPLMAMRTRLVHYYKINLNGALTRIPLSYKQ